MRRMILLAAAAAMIVAWAALPARLEAPAEAASPPKYVGSTACKSCHFVQYKSWAQTRMGRAFESLEAGMSRELKVKAGLDPDKDYTHDPTCLPCHTTGYGEPGGFTSIEETPVLAGVGCEACHGPGGEYLKIMTIDNKDHLIQDMIDLGLRYPPREKQCLVCHGENAMFTEEVHPRYEWNFEERLHNEEGMHKHKPLTGEHPDLEKLDPVFQ